MAVIFTCCMTCCEKAVAMTNILTLTLDFRLGVLSAEQVSTAMSRLQGLHCVQYLVNSHSFCVLV